MERVIYSKSGGCGLILDENEREEDFILPMGVQLHGNELNPGDYTTLDGMFSEKLRFVGIMTDSEHVEMVFHAGDDADLFESKKYYYIFYWLTENRIANSYAPRTVRDFFWVGHWK
ncbi:hypothetical protein H0S70_07045 [Chryseobacterium manosquense]|uniref:Uncharacterized protein n=1 Tax=Chryseobacterium manosquense TaxID=2754694 RepID=A0A7H1DT54_9FLAO|nr:hypothetical protein [Chryseobacterium manosquense]QNS40162.1 hypothetical protein H0S70_07045 [Chryseobacterium manosquense]